MDVLFEIAIIFALLLANGVFAMAEIAIVSSRKAKLRMQADAGSHSARKALALAESPNRFLSTVQIGISLVGIFAGAYGGASLTQNLAAVLKQVKFLAPYANPVAFTIVVLCITYFSLVIGELVPKRVGLSNPEKIASLLSGPMTALSAIARPLVTFLSASTETLLRLLGLKQLPEATVSEDELKLLAREGLRAGVLHPTETQMLEGVLALDKVRVHDLMTPRAKIIWVQEDEPHDRLWHKIVVSAHTSFPVYSTSRDQIVGIVTVKSIYANLAAGIPVRIRDLMTDSLVVPASQNALALLETFKNTGRHIALVSDEFGHITGIATMHDIMEAIVGEMPTMDKRLRPTAKHREDGTWLVDALIPIEEFEQVVKEFPIDPPTQRDYETFGGLILKRLGHVPREGECFTCGKYTVEIIDMDHHRVDKVLLIPEKSPLQEKPATHPS